MILASLGAHSFITYLSSKFFFLSQGFQLWRIYSIGQSALRNLKVCWNDVGYRNGKAARYAVVHGVNHGTNLLHAAISFSRDFSEMRFQNVLNGMARLACKTGVTRVCSLAGLMATKHACQEYGSSDCRWSVGEYADSACENFGEGSGICLNARKEYAIVGGWWNDGWEKYVRSQEENAKIACSTGGLKDCFEASKGRKPGEGVRAFCHQNPNDCAALHKMFADECGKDATGDHCDSIFENYADSLHNAGRTQEGLEVLKGRLESLCNNSNIRDYQCFEEATRYVDKTCGLSEEACSTAYETSLDAVCQQVTLSDKIICSSIAHKIVNKACQDTKKPYMSDVEKYDTSETCIDVSRKALDQVCRVQEDDVCCLDGLHYVRRVCQDGLDGSACSQAKDDFIKIACSNHNDQACERAMSEGLKGAVDALKLCRDKQNASFSCRNSKCESEEKAYNDCLKSVNERFRKQWDKHLEVICGNNNPQSCVEWYTENKWANDLLKKNDDLARFWEVACKDKDRCQAACKEGIAGIRSQFTPDKPQFESKCKEALQKHGIKFEQWKEKVIDEARKAEEAHQKWWNDQYRKYFGSRRSAGGRRQAACSPIPQRIESLSFPDKLKELNMGCKDHAAWAFSKDFDWCQFKKDPQKYLKSILNPIYLEWHPDKCLKDAYNQNLCNEVVIKINEGRYTLENIDPQTVSC